MSKTMNFKNSKQKKWNKEITKTLVELYELQPVLYNTSLPTYHNRMTRHKALKIIQQELENMFNLSYSRDVILRKLHNLRTQFLEVHRNSTNISTDPGDEPSWWLYQHLKFLLPFCKKDKSESNLSPKNINVDPLQNHSQRALEDYEYCNISENEIEEKFNETNTESFYEDEEFESNPHTDSENVVSPAASTSPESPSSSNKTLKVNEEIRIGVKRKRSNESIPNILADAVKKSSNENLDNSHEIQSFCHYIGHELAHFKKESSFQKCKWEILQIIHTILTSEMDEN